MMQHIEHEKNINPQNNKLNKYQLLLDFFSTNTPNNQPAKYQWLLDFFWSFTIGGVIGELFGCYLSWYFLSLIYLHHSIVLGILWGGLCYVTAQIIIRLKRSQIKEIRLDFIGKQISHLFKQRRYLTCENVVRQLLATSSKTIQSPELVRCVMSITPYIENYNRIVFTRFLHFLWFILGGAAFAFVTERILWSKNLLFNELQNNFKIIPENFIRPLSDGILLSCWFILIVFILGVLLTFLGKRSSIRLNATILGIAVPISCLLPIVFSILLPMFREYIIQNSNNDSGIERIVQFISYIFLLNYPVLCFLMSATIFSLTKNIYQENKIFHLPNQLFVYIFVLFLLRDWKPAIYLPDAFSYAFLMVNSGLFFSLEEFTNEKDHKQLSVNRIWLLIPACCLVVGFFNATLESAWIKFFSVITALLVGGFWSAREMSVRTLIKLFFFAVVILTFYNMLRNLNGISTVLPCLFGIWAANCFYVALLNKEQVFIRVTFWDKIVKLYLRIRYVNVGYSVQYLTQTEWFKKYCVPVPYKETPSKVSPPPLPPQLPQNKQH